MTPRVSLAVYLSLNIQLMRDGQTLFHTIPLLPLTLLCQGLWPLVGLGLWLGERVTTLGLGLVKRLAVSLTVVEIGCTAVAWGVR